MQVPPSAKIFDVLIVGGGLSGLFVGSNLQWSSSLLQWRILEASDRMGGRLVNASPSLAIDMGGAWIWPEHQRNIRELAKSVDTFPQPDDSSSTRIVGGAEQFIKTLAKQISAENLQLNSPVKLCKLLRKSDAAEDVIQVETSSGTKWLARKVVFAVPPKLLHESVTFDPPLSKAKQHAMATSHTWMAGVTKVALAYPLRFWDLRSSNMGLASSPSGPAFQVYDGSSKNDSVIALTFLTHVTPMSPAQKDDALLAKQVASQMEEVWEYLSRPYSKQAHSYDSFHIYRWPNQPFISGSDSSPVNIHPHPMPLQALAMSEWDNRLLFAGSETDQTSPGVMEGAIGAAKRVLKSLQ